MPGSIPTRHHVSRNARALLDTSVVIDLGHINADTAPRESAMSAVTLAELSAGLHTASDPYERARRQRYLQQLESQVETEPFGPDAARAYGEICAAVVAAGRKPRGRRSLDFMIAATARAAGLPLYTRNPSDFEGLEDLVEIVILH